MITQAEYESFSPEKKAEIEQKCKESPAYFYNNFCRKEGQPEMTDEQFMAMKKFAENPFVLKKRPRPLSPSKCYEFLPDFLKK